jgi:hypothetical protein
MPRVLPSQVITAIDTLFGPRRNELDGRAVTHNFRSEVYALLELLDEVPGELIDLNAQDYLELSRCRAVLATALPAWNLGDIAPAKPIGGKDAVERIRRLMMLCHDQLPPAEPELPFIADDDVRLGIEDRIHAAWTDFGANEWFGATVLAGAALEALLLWALKRPSVVILSKTPLDELLLVALIDEAHKAGVISEGARQQASLAKDARNLIHPGKASRLGQSCNKATALTALAGVYRVIGELTAKSN